MDARRASTSSAVERTHSAGAAPACQSSAACAAHRVDSSGGLGRGGHPDRPPVPAAGPFGGRSLPRRRQLQPPQPAAVVVVAAAAAAVASSAAPDCCCWRRRRRTCRISSEGKEGVSIAKAAEQKNFRTDLVIIALLLRGLSRPLLSLAGELRVGHRLEGEVRPSAGVVVAAVPVAEEADEERKEEKLDKANLHHPPAERLHRRLTAVALAVLNLRLRTGPSGDQVGGAV